jgi:hypothetical protein
MGLDPARPERRGDLGFRIPGRMYKKFQQPNRWCVHSRHELYSASGQLPHCQNTGAGPHAP